MSRTGLVALLLLVASILACEQAGDLIPGQGSATPESTVGTDPTPIVVTPDLQTGSDTATPTPSIPDHELARSVVQIRAVDTANGLERTTRDGSGVIVDSEAGLILTAYSIVRPYLSTGAPAYTTIAIGVNDGNGGAPRLEYEARLVALDELLGLAVLRVTSEYGGDALPSDGLVFPAADRGDASIVEPGNALRLFGHPGLSGSSAESQTLTVTEGKVTGRRGEPDHAGTTRLKLDVQLPYGTTGGPAFNRGGSVVGILVPEHYNVGAPVTQLRPINVAEALIASARALPEGVPFIAPLHAQEPPGGFEAPIPTDQIWVSEPYFAENTTNTAGQLDLFDYERGFVSGTQELYFEYVVQGAQTGAMVEERWYLNDVLQDALSSDYAWDRSTFAFVADKISVAGAALPDGRWRLEVWVNGTLRADATAVVGVDLDPPVMFNPVFGSLAGASGQSLSGPTAAASQILLFFDYTGMDITGGVRWLIQRDGELMYQSPEMRWPGDAHGRFWIGFSTPDGVGAGRWTFQVLVDGAQTLESAWDVF
ncbi:MAG: serine protease [Chloroflexi bacterium]|nr:serine protease [Chloroflexota bacterium]MDA1145520.1 serine protease [Chloroflexota bacterium]